MSKFFIYRPIFAWVIAIMVSIAGLVSITLLPIAQFPSVAPPTIQVHVAYPGATADKLDETVLSVLERQMNGIENLMYVSTAAEANGSGSLTVVFKPGTNEDIAQVEVQNRIARAESRLPAVVRQLGITVIKSMSNFLLVTSFTSTDPNVKKDDISDYVSRNILPEIQKIDGVGNARLFGSERALRVWLDADKLRSLNMSTEEVNAAISAQNIQISGGSLGDTPSIKGQKNSATIVIPGQLTNEKEFRDIIVRTGSDGSSLVRLGDIARVELGAESYAFDSRTNGKQSTAIGVQLSSSGNAMATSEKIQEKMKELEKFLPSGMEWSIPYDTSGFVALSIEKVMHTLFEAIVLVFIVMLFFLQKIRYTIIPTIVVPIALLGTFAILYAFGMSINILAMFAMVLVIGIVVDDAIVVVENVERIMTTEGLPPKKATEKAMTQIQGAVIGITVILISVFIPLALFTGATGNIYRQFAVVMAVSIAFSGFFALTLTPALCGSLLQQHNVNETPYQRRKGLSKIMGLFFSKFNYWFGRRTTNYQKNVAKTLRRPGITAVVYLIIIVVIGGLFKIIPTAFVPVEDQGFVITNIQLRSGATQESAREVMEKIQQHMEKQDEVENVIAIMGFNFSGQGQNAGLAFITLKDWSKRTPNIFTRIKNYFTNTPNPSDATNFAARMTRELSSIKEAMIFVISPPAIPELGMSNGFELMLQDRGGLGHEGVLNARNQLMGMAAQSKVLVNVRPNGLEDASQLQIEINREAASAQGVSVASIASVLGTYLGSTYVNDFPNNGRMQRVTVQAEAANRMGVDDVLKLTVPNSSGVMIPLSTFVTTKWITGPMQVKRYNGYIAMQLSGEARPGFSSGDAMNEIETLIKKLPEGIGYEWTGISLDEKKAGSQSIILYAFSILAVFLCLAALYESWTIPLAVVLVVPLGVLGVLFGAYMFNIPNDIYFQVALITVIGLSAKNAILIVEFAKDIQLQGKTAVQSALEAAKLRFRPIIMTSLAFIFGVVPLCFASGASAASQREIGIAVFFGMVVGTSLAVFMVPSFYAGVRKLFKFTVPQEEVSIESVLESDKEKKGNE